jgi:hypothetical protein
VAVGGAVFLGFTQNQEVRGSSEMAVQEPVARAEGVPEMLEPAHEEMEDWRSFMLHLRAEDYTTYIDPVHHFSFAYPAAFHLASADTVEGGQIVVEHSTFPVRVGITIHPLDRSAELVEELNLMGEEYEAEPPEGVGEHSRVIREKTRRQLSHR